jgi:cyclopropane-fatty-acyl-phospholipid synthase
MNAKHTDDAGTARGCMSILQDLLRDYHPRNFAVRLWNGTTWDAEAGEPTLFTMVICRPGALRAMLLSGGERALGHAYVSKCFDIEGDLADAFPMAEYLLRLRLTIRRKIGIGVRLLRLPADDVSGAGRRAARLSGEIHSVERDRQAVTYHYDTSNDFFRLFLDRHMVYSCAYFDSPNEDLDSAQERKLDYICRKLRLKEGQRLLDIGCGWGGLIRFAAKNYGVTALGITLSEPQARLANARIREDKLGDRCRAGVRDYRQVGDTESFDAVVSIGMVEHVGERMLPEYFGHARRLLRPGGVFLNHGIARAVGVDGDRTGSFSQAYVFPDSDPVSLNVSTRVAEEAGFEVRDVESLREHYALTLRHWVRRLESHREEAIRATDEATYRTWRMFMTASALEFDAGRNNVYQSLFVKSDNGRSGLPLTRAAWYREAAVDEHAELWH